MLKGRQTAKREQERNAREQLDTLISGYTAYSYMRQYHYMYVYVYVHMECRQQFICFNIICSSM